ncbi:MAG: putative beta-lactamase-inhibitor-like, PepSY-like [Bacteroidota bacterium]|jgi:hypothetical protein
MKKLFLISTVIIAFASCQKIKDLNPFDKKDKAETLCPVVIAEQVPSAVTTAFAAKYPAATAITWFNKDNTGFCAAFTNNGIEAKALFDNAGNFVSEEVKGNHQDGQQHNESGCECEIAGSDKH